MILLPMPANHLDARMGMDGCSRQTLKTGKINSHKAKGRPQKLSRPVVSSAQQLQTHKHRHKPRVLSALFCARPSRQGTRRRRFFLKCFFGSVYFLPLPRIRRMWPLARKPIRTLIGIGAVVGLDPLDCMGMGVVDPVHTAVPGRAVGSCPLEDTQVTAIGRTVARVGVPLAAVGPQPL